MKLSPAEIEELFSRGYLVKEDLFRDEELGSGPNRSPQGCPAPGANRFEHPGSGTSRPLHAGAS